MSARVPPDLTWETNLWATGDERVSTDQRADLRLDLGDGSWVDQKSCFLSGSGALFSRLVDQAPWCQPEVTMYGRKVAQPRLTAFYPFDTGAPDEPIVEEMRRLLTGRYDVDFDSVGLALYRDGRDSVAFHSDRHARHTPNPTIAIVSLGSRRRFLLRPKGGGRSHRFELEPGDLLVMGGSCQHRWEHAVPKVAHAGPRLCIMYRHGIRADDYQSLGQTLSDSARG